MTTSDFCAFLEALRDAGARLGGSFALGREDSKPDVLSDIDLIVLPPRMDDYSDYVRPTPIERVIAVFDRFGVPWTSVITGAINSPRDTTTLPRPVEVMETTWIDHDPEMPATREIFGVTFDCHQRPWRGA